MVCPRCVESVEQIFNDLGIVIIEIQLGRVLIHEMISSSQKEILVERLVKKGFQLLDDKHTKLISNIKSILIQHIHFQDQLSSSNYSTILSESLNYEYSYLSRLFSSVEGQTIERFILAQKIEKVKELLTYDELTIAEIAYQLHYSSPAHLSSQFKRITGMSPSTFKKIQNQERRFLDEL